MRWDGPIDDPDRHRHWIAASISVGAHAFLFVMVDIEPTIPEREEPEVLEVAPVTVEKDWTKAKAWLRRELKGS